ncbi:MAG: hypothetical protein JRH20_02150 [Deltaproteobacteria bacterium]|nr:hypothetical protein [Deltaproteobacteria bacterium]
MPRIYLAAALVERQAFDIGPELAVYKQSTPDTSSYKGKIYSNKAPGMSFLAAPAYALLSALEGPNPPIAKVFFWLRVGGATVPTLLFLCMLSWLLREILPRKRQLQRLLLVGYACGTMTFVYGTLLFSHHLSAAFVASSFILIFLYSRTRTGRNAPLWAGLLAGAGVLVDYQVAFLGPALFVYVLYAARPRLRVATLFCCGAALPLGLLLYYHWRCFGHPLSTGYEHLTNPIFAQWTSRGFLGLDIPELGRFHKLHFSADDGLFYYSPFLLLAFPGLALMIWRRSLRAEGLLAGFAIAFNIYFISALVLVSGWDVGPRYMIAALPFYVVPIAAVLRDLATRWYLLVVPSGLIAVSCGSYLLVGAVFPHFPDNFSNPLFDVSWRFGAAGYLPYNLGWLLGWEGVTSILPFALVAVLVLFVPLWRSARDAWRGLALTVGALVVASLVVTSYWFGLNHREQVVPHSFLPWMERIWEPRHLGMDKKEVLRDIGPVTLQAGFKPAPGRAGPPPPR